MIYDNVGERMAFLACLRIVLGMASITIPSVLTSPSLRVHGSKYVRGIHYAEVGMPVHIECTSTNNTSRLIIQHKGIVLSSASKPGDKSIQTTVQRDKPVKDVYICCQDNCPRTFDLRRMSMVTVKYVRKGMKVDNFQCVSVRYENLNCSWTVSSSVDLLNWTLVYCIAGSQHMRGVGTCVQKPYRLTAYKSHYSCSVAPRDFYRGHSYLINITGMSGISTAFHQQLVVASLDIVQYSQVRGLSVQEMSTSNDIVLQWMKPERIHTARPVYKIDVFKLTLTEETFVGNHTTGNSRYTLTGLDPSTTYIIYLRSKPSRSRYWSSPFSLTVTTRSAGSGLHDKTKALMVGLSVFFSLLALIALLSFVRYHWRRTMKRIPIDTPTIQDDPLNKPQSCMCPLIKETDRRVMARQVVDDEHISTNVSDKEESPSRFDNLELVHDFRTNSRNSLEPYIHICTDNSNLDSKNSASTPLSTDIKVSQEKQQLTGDVNENSFTKELAYNPNYVTMTDTGLISTSQM